MKTKIIFSILFATLITNSFSIIIPDRLRGGSFYNDFLNKHPSKFLDSVARTWQSRVDNFDENNKTTFAQRYYVNDSYWKKGSGPVFYEIGGEGTLNGPPKGFVEELAKKYGALLIALEHRFYGESIPNNSLETANLKYLTVEQALADLSNFTNYFKSIENLSKDTPWVVFGGSYPGALSSWYRYAYPEQSVGALSSSGVVNCIVDYYGFDMAVSAAAGNTCGHQIRTVRKAFENLIKSDGLKKALDMFNCEADMSETDFHYFIADSWSMVIQYSAKSKLCSVLDPKLSDEQLMTAFSNFSKGFWGLNFCSMGFCKYFVKFR